MRVHSVEPVTATEEASVFPKGFNAKGERVVRASKGTTRPDPIWPEYWSRMSDVAQAKARAVWEAGRPLKADYRTRGSKKDSRKTNGPGIAGVSHSVCLSVCVSVCLCV